MPVGLQLLARSDEIVVSNWLVAGLAGVRHGLFPMLVPTTRSRNRHDYVGRRSTELSLG